jgi:hypothetical protein
MNLTNVLQQRNGVSYAVGTMMLYTRPVNAVSQLRVVVAEAQGQFENPEEGKCPPLEAVTRRLVRTQQAKKTQVCVLVNLLSV